MVKISALQALVDLESISETVINSLLLILQERTEDAFPSLLAVNADRCIADCYTDQAVLLLIQLGKDYDIVKPVVRAWIEEHHTKMFVRHGIYVFQHLH